MSGVWAAVPVKSFAGAKQRLSELLDADPRHALAAAMLEDVLRALADAKLSGIIVNTIDPDAAALGERYGALVMTEGAEQGHTGAVSSIATRLEREGREAMLAIPGDIPMVTTADINAVVAARESSGFVIVPARDELGSNAVLCSPPTVIPLRFGEDSYFPHLIMARRAGLEPKVV